MPNENTAAAEAEANTFAVRFGLTTAGRVRFSTILVYLIAIIASKSLATSDEHEISVEAFIVRNLTLFAWNNLLHAFGLGKHALLVKHFAALIGVDFTLLLAAYLKYFEQKDGMIVEMIALAQGELHG